MGGVAATIGIGAADAGTAAVVAEGVAAGTTIAEGLATGALTDLGGGVLLDGTGALIDASTGTLLTDVGGGTFLNATTGALVDAAGSALPEVSSGVFQTAAGDLVSASGEAMTQLGDGSLLNTVTGDIIDATGQSLGNLTSEGLQATDLSGSSIDQATGNITQTFDDGSTLTTDSTGNVISNTPAPADPLSLPSAADALKYGNLAKTAYNNLLAPATKALAGNTGFNPTTPGTTGGLPTTQTQTQAPATTTSSQRHLTPGLSSGNANYNLGSGTTPGLDLYGTPTNTGIQQSQAPNPATQSYAMGGDVQSNVDYQHNPSFFSEGGMENRYVQGEGNGTSDDVAAMLADGEFVIPADVVSRLGNGSSNAGAHVLDQFLSVVRADKNDHDPHELPPDSKGPLAYLAQAQKKA
jgi:hypothetical protein